MKNIFYIIAAIFVFGLTSCSDEEESLFADSAANRITAAQKNCREVLTNAPNGWVMEYYAGNNSSEMERRIGGLVFLLDFNTDGSVRITSEYEDGAVPAKTVITSTYDLIANQSVVLTFDTYNNIFHFFSEPNSSDLDGMGGDYEFVVMNVSPEKINLKGRRKGNRIVMYPIKEGVDWDTYIDDIKVFKKKISYSRFNVFVDGTQTDETVALDIINHNLITSNQYFREENVTFSPNSINLYSPVRIAGHPVESFTWDETQGKLVTSVNNVTIALEGYNPEGYNTYEDYIGTYWINYANYTGMSVAKRGSIREIDGTSFLELTGLDFPVKLKYNNITGSIYFDFQHIPLQVPNPTYEFYLFNWFGGESVSTDGKLNYSGRWAKDSSGRNVIEFSSNDLGSGHIGMCFVGYSNGTLYLITENSFFQELKLTER